MAITHSSIRLPKCDDSENQPQFIFTPADVGRIYQSDLHTAHFANETYWEIAQLLEELAILERTTETKMRAWKHEKVSHGEIRQEVNSGRGTARTRMHNIFLAQYSETDAAKLVLMPADVYRYRDLESKLVFRDRDLQNVAHNISMIACFEQELETYLTRQGGYEEPERLAMIKDTLHRLQSNKDHLTKILIGYYNK